MCWCSWRAHKTIIIIASHDQVFVSFNHHFRHKGNLKLNIHFLIFHVFLPTYYFTNLNM
ncbi:hypothetical protein HanXRQr2_Chr09g0377121 [Helianthus annuus]|uniref:Uncharacterized protein n=1 Tax=Helianthus annuus TaxID=4232 RepID=A0A9K3I4I0_HELAN|nr:hypothetical protein HanXRQr2_Chr09g0377121 [Helianthus annuus]